MGVWIVFAVLVTLVLVIAARALAQRRHRNAFVWGLATALCPPALLVLLALPKRNAA